MHLINMDKESRQLSKIRRKRLTSRLQTLRDRVNLLELELIQHTSHHFRVCIFGSARIKPDDELYKITEKVGCLLGEKGIDVLTGGGPGLMEAANKGVLAGNEKSGSGSKSFGITIELGDIEPPSEHLDIKHHHRKFSSRLDDFMRLSNAVIIVPGGIGTLLELYYSWQLIQVGHLAERPIVLLKKDFWNGIITWMKEVQLENKLVSPGDFDCISIVDTPEEIIDVIKDEYNKFQESKGL